MKIPLSCTRALQFSAMLVHFSFSWNNGEAVVHWIKSQQTKIEVHMYLHVFEIDNNNQASVCPGFVEAISREIVYTSKAFKSGWRGKKEPWNIWLCRQVLQGQRRQDHCRQNLSAGRMKANPFVKTCCGLARAIPYTISSLNFHIHPGRVAS